MLTRLAGAGVGFLTQFLLLKLMGSHELGLFYSASSLAAVTGVIAAQGYPQVAARFTGRYRNKRDDAMFGSFIRHTMREGLIAALAAALFISAWALFWQGFGATGERVVFAIAGWMVLAIVTLNILTNVAGGMRLFNLCYMPEGFIRPILFFAAVGGAGLAGLTLDAQTAMIVFAVITLLLAGVVAFLLGRNVPRTQPQRSARPALAWRWRNEAWQLVLLAVFTNFFADVGILVVVPFLSSAEVAVFGFCLKLALLVGYFVQIGQQMAVPDLADARHVGDTGRLRHAALKSIGIPTLITLLALFGTALFGDWVLSFFGPEFDGARYILLVLLAAQLLRAVAGPSAHLLTLNGTQSVNLTLAVTSLLVLVISSAFLAPQHGALGAAFAVLITYAYWIGASAFALVWLKEQPVDILQLLLMRRSTAA